MSETHDWSTFYWHTMRYPKGTPYRAIEKAETLEQEDPYRTGRALALRAPLLNSVLVVGRWGPAGEPVLEDEHNDRLAAAMHGKQYTLDPRSIAAMPRWSTDITASLGPLERISRAARARWEQWQDARWERRHGPTYGDDLTVDDES